MDFLAKHVVQLDSDERQIRILETTPSDLGTAVPIRFRNGTPYATATIELTHEQALVLDTGYYAAESVGLSRQSFDALARARPGNTVARAFDLITIAGAAQETRTTGARTLLVGDVAAFDVGIAEAKANQRHPSFFDVIELASLRNLRRLKEKLGCLTTSSLLAK